MDDQGFVFVVVLGTVFVLGLILLVGVLMVVNTGRRQRHRAEIAEVRLKHAHEVMAAEREAVGHTLQEVGTELHDNVSQLLMVIHVGLNWGPEAKVPDPHLDPAREALAECINEVRSLGHTLNLDLWKNNTVQEAILRLADRLNRSGKWTVNVVSEGDPITLPSDANAILFRVCQEVVANAIKHSGARSITITFQDNPAGITIADNGVGFDPTAVVGHAGLRNIGRRCALIGFEAQCITAAGQGCTWKFTRT